MSELKPIQPTPSELLARLVQQQATLTQRVDELTDEIHTGNERLIQVIQAQAGMRSVKVLDINMPFWALTGLLVKVALASIPAYIFLGAIGALLFALFGVSLTSCAALLGQ